MSRPRVIAVLAAGLLAFAASGCAAAPGTQNEQNSDFDPNFLASWFGLDSAAAGKLAQQGAAAAATRRSLMADQAATGTFGEAALPGAYPPPRPKGPQVSFTTFLKGVASANMAAGKPGRAAWEALVTRIARAAGGAKAAAAAASGAVAYVDYFNPGQGGTFVRTTVSFVVNERIASQEFLYSIKTDPGPKAPWLVNAYPGSYIVISPASPTSSIACANPNCKLCPEAPGKCIQCAEYAGTKGTAAWYTVYRNDKDQCAACTRPNCKTCAANGKCAVCKPGANYYINSQGNCAVCSRANCQTCAANGRCATCKPGGNFYINTQGNCAVCPSTCQTCAANGKCTACKPGNYYINSQGTCSLCARANCQRCATDGKCAACADGFYITTTGACARCTKPNCRACKDNSNGSCAACESGFLSNGNCCSDNLCSICTPSGSTCLQCKATSTFRQDGSFVTVSVYRDAKGDCRGCLVPNCAVCRNGTSNTLGVCSRCQLGYVLRRGTCRKA